MKSGSTFSHIFHLLKKDLLLEIRQQYSFYGVMLYMAATIFVLFLAIKEPENQVWNGMFWVIQLFICINAVAKSFLQESRSKMLYYYTIVSPVNYMLAKLLFNTLLMAVMSLMSLLLFILFFDNPTPKIAQLIGIVLLGSWSLNLVFTFLAAIAASARQSAAIMAILGFPLLVPQILLLMQATHAVFNTMIPIQTVNILLLVGLDILIISLSLILYPFLWKD